HVVGEQREQHGEIEELEHAVVEPQPRCIDSSVLAFDAYVRPGEERGRQAHERGERYQENVEWVDEEELPENEQRSLGDDAPCEGDRGNESQCARGDVDARSLVALADNRKN